MDTVSLSKWSKKKRCISAFSPAVFWSWFTNGPGGELNYSAVALKNIRCVSCSLSEPSASPFSVYTPGRGHGRQHLASILHCSMSFKHPLSNISSQLGFQWGSHWRGREGSKQRQGDAVVARHPHWGKHICFVPYSSSPPTECSSTVSHRGQQHYTHTVLLPSTSA